MRVSLLAGTALAIVCASSAAQAAWDDWNVEPLRGSIYDLEYSVGGEANGTVFSAHQPATSHDSGVTGEASLFASIKRNYDSGLSLGLNGVFSLYHDKFSGDNYGSDFLAKLYGTAQTGLGRIEVGMADGAAYQLAIVGPVVNPEVSVDNPNTTAFFDPSTSAALIDIFALNSAVESSLNYAKISYFTPRLFGLQLGVSFTPSESKQIVPFVNIGPSVANRQVDMWEAAFNYTETFDAFTVGLYGGFTFGHNDTKTAGHAGLTDVAFGTEVDWEINDDWKLAVGGAYRNANTYTFDINTALASGATESIHASTVLTYGSWALGAEMGVGRADGSLGLPTLQTHQYVIDVGYTVNANLSFAAGWQKLHYTTNGAPFYNGFPRLEADAWFLHGIFNI